MSVSFCNPLSGKYGQMIEDDLFFNVTCSDVKSLLQHMASRPTIYSREDIIRMRIKYDPWIDDKEKRFMVKYGLDYEHHVITKGTATGKGAGLYLNLSNLFVNGYTENQWRMLTDETYEPYLSRLLNFMDLCRKNEDFDALAILEAKYGKALAEREKRILEKNGIPLNTKYETLAYNTIDGKPFHVWKLLNDPNYFPCYKGALISLIRQLRNNDEIEDAEAIETKYFDFLYPGRREDPISQAEITAANAYLQQFTAPYKPKSQAEKEEEQS